MLLSSEVELLVVVVVVVVVVSVVFFVSVEDLLSAELVGVVFLAQLKIVHAAIQIMNTDLMTGFF
jgi:hypothetical protein